METTLLQLKILQKLGKSVEWKIRNNFPSGSKLKFRTEFELKFLGAELLLNLAKFIGGSNLFGKI
jgi:hypothetical protein